MATLRNLVFALVVIGAAGNAHGEEEAHGEVTHGTGVPTHQTETEGNEKSKAELEAEVLKLKAELEKATLKESETVEGSALVLLFSVAFVMLIFYLVNSKIEVVRKQTWNITSTSISIFAAVMLNICVKEIFIAVGVRPGNGALITEFITLIGWWLAAVALLYWDRDSLLRLVGWGTVYGHILGFAAIGAYGTLAATAPFNESHWMTLVVIVIYIFSIPILVAPTALLGRCIKHEALHEQCKETAIDFFSMGLSYLIAMFFRGWIKFRRTGTAAGQHAVGVGSEPHEVGILLAVGMLFLVIGALFHLLQKRSKPPAGSKSSAAMSETFHLLATIAAMTCAWCLMQGMTWVSLKRVAPNAHAHAEHRRLSETGIEGEGLGMFHMPQGVFMAKLMVAAFFTLIFVLAVFIFSGLTQLGGKETRTLLKGSITAVSLVVGLSWEHLFDTAIEEVTEMARNEKAKQWLKVVLSLTLVFISIPAWMSYILPKHNAELIEKYEGKQLSVFACLGDCCDTDDDEESGDYEEAEDEDDEE